MPDRGDERGRGGTRTLVTGILAGTEWHPATNPQEATQTAREARDLAVRLRPVLSKLAQAPRGGRRRDLEWLPAVEQLAVDAQYFASWWLPRLEGKSAGSWPSWSADGYADWVKRLDAQRLRTLEMVEGTAPVTRIASVTQLRRGKGTNAEPDTETTSMSEAGSGSGLEAGSEPASTPAPPPGAQDFAEPHAPARHARDGGDPAEDFGEEHTARITPLRGPGAALMDAALMEMSGAPEAPGMQTEPAEPSMSADETHISRATPITAPGAEDAITSENRGDRGTGGGFAESTAPTTPDATDLSISGTEDSLPSVPRTPPNQGPEYSDPDTTHISRAPADRVPLGFDDLAADAADAAVVADAAMPLVPRTPPNQGPDDTHVGADIVQIPRTPPNSGPTDAELSRTPLNAGPAAADRPRGPRAPVVSLVGDDDLPRVPRTPPNPGPGPGAGAGAGPGASAGPGPIAAGAIGAGSIVAGSKATRSKAAGSNSGSNGSGLSADTDADSTHVSLASPGPAALGTGAGAGSGARPGAGTLPDESTRPLFRPEPKAPAPSSAAAATTAAIAGAAVSAAAMGSGPIGSGAVGSGAMGSGAVASGGGGHDEFEHFQPGSDMPPPVFPMTEPVEPVDRGRIVRYALAAVVVAVCCVAAFVALSGKSSGNKTAAPPATRPSTSAVPPSTSDSSSSVDPGAVTAPTSTDTPPPVSSTASKPPVIPPKPNPPASSAPTTAAPPSHTSAAPPPPVQTTHQQPPPASGGVSSLSVSSLSADQSGGFNYVAHVHVTTRGTGSVTVTVTFAGSESGNSPGSIGAQSQSFTLSGKTSYDLDPGVDVHGVCSSGSAPYIDAVASASGAGSSVAYASSPC
ncbi:hypothetical protein KGQ19_46465 [Catenulispora sp. NL8]|uniref:Uncharacterized protein n=1 Tax=Catenulispora pinistramenti TaxID=2705254 RepID=A0ABS5L873_9ACTN|nr:hypothetical protein [Catenulispora pinistramenti]MBS2554324.1 hypothetical protein [Catenulispora pinistramenti]